MFTYIIAHSKEKSSKVNLKITEVYKTGKEDNKGIIKDEHLFNWDLDHNFAFTEFWNSIIIFVEIDIESLRLSQWCCSIMMC